MLWVWTSGTPEKKDRQEILPAIEGTIGSNSFTQSAEAEGEKRG